MNRLRELFTSRLGRVALPVGLVAAVALTACRGASTEAPAGGAGGRGGARGGRAGFGGGAQPVVVARVTQKDIPVDIAAVGNVEAFATIAVRSQVTGQLEEVMVTEGNTVKKGDILYTLDRRPLESQLQQAQANLERDQSLLAQAEAQLARDAANAEYQQLQSERQAQLVKQGIISKDVGEQSRASADATAATVKADKANVESARAQLRIQQAQLENAQVQLSYAVGRAPISGRLGDIAVKAGNLVTANNTQITTISQVQPVFVTFAVPATHLPTIKRHSSGKDRLSVVATPQDVEAMPAEGQLTFVDSLVDSTTDTIKLKATFPNTDSRLWPGQFARVSLRLTTLESATVVPQQAVQTGQDGQFVFVVNNGGRGGRGGGRGRGQGAQGGGQAQGGQAPAAQGDGQARGGQAQGAPAQTPAGGEAPAAPALTVEQRPVVVAQRVGEDVVIEKGLQVGETVVTEGQLRLENGTRVQISDANGNAAGGARGARGGRGRGQGQGGEQAQGQGGGQRQGGEGQAGQGQGGQGQGQSGQRGQ